MWYLLLRQCTDPIIFLCVWPPQGECKPSPAWYHKLFYFSTSRSTQHGAGHKACARQMQLIDEWPGDLESLIVQDSTYPALPPNLLPLRRCPLWCLDDRCPSASMWMWWKGGFQREGKIHLKYCRISHFYWRWAQIIYISRMGSWLYFRVELGIPWSP